MGITVIIRSMGRPTLDRAIASVRAQDLPGVEILIVDAKGRGLQRAAAAQAGLDEAITRWALFLDDDDELLAGHLSKLGAAVQDNPHALAAYTGVEQRREGHAEVLATWNRPFEPWELLAANALPIHAVLFDRDRVRAAGVCFDASLDTFEDWDFWLQVQSVGPMVHVEGISARYWLSASGQSAAQSAHHGDHLYQAIWHKWWRLAPPEWWHQMWRAARDEPILRHRLSLAEAARRQTDAARVQAQDARAQAQDARAQAEEARLMAEESLEQARGILSRQMLELRDAHALAQSRQLELDHLHGQATAMLGRLEHQQIQLREVSQQVDGLRLAEQGVRSHLHAVLQSRSWKLTAPLRWLGRQMRRVWKLRSADARRHLWWRLRHRSYPRPALLSAVLPDPYQRWLVCHDGNGPRERQQALGALAQMERAGASSPSPASDRAAGLPLISVLMPVYNPPLDFWDEAIESLRAQWYPHWELCMADDASTDPRVRERLQAWAEREPRIRWVTLAKNGHISAASNAALELATGSWVALFDQDDLLPPQALWRVVAAITAHPDAGLLYSDEDKVDEAGQRFGPYFKPAFDLDLLRGQNMISHLGVYRRSLLQEVGGFRVGYEGSQDHDLALRCIERLKPSQVVHIPRVLYHWRVHQHSTASGQAAKPYALDAGVRAVQDHLQRCGVRARVQSHPAIPHHVVVHEAPASNAQPGPECAGLHVVIWGDTPSTAQSDTQRANEAVWEALTARLQEQDLDVQQTVSVQDWRAACVQLKVWAAQGRSGAVLLLHGPFLHQGSSDIQGLRALHAHLGEAEVGAVGWAVREASGALHDAGWVRQPDGGARPVARGSGWDTHGYYGQLCLAHRVSALNGGAVMVRLDAIQADRPGLQLKAGWRAVWSPQGQWVGVPAHLLSPLVVGAAINPALIVEAWDAQHGLTDPAFSPHLCAEHADHRMALLDETQAEAQGRFGAGESRVRLNPMP
jgi:glycosyltransferase involved in cell wall biosynthesis